MLYQVLCLARPMAAGELSAMMQKVGSTVYNAGGVVTDVKSYGKQYLAYKIRGVHGKFDQVRLPVM
jgi:ribosomal protein S6